MILAALEQISKIIVLANGRFLTDIFDEIVLDVWNEHVLMEKKYLRANEGPFMTKAVRKAIMIRTHLRNRNNEVTTKRRLLKNREIYV